MTGLGGCRLLYKSSNLGSGMSIGPSRYMDRDDFLLVLPHDEEAVAPTLALDDRPPRYDDVSDIKP